MKKCPICGGTNFFVSVHVVQDWLVDENGNWIDTENDCVEVTHRPDDIDWWQCANCGYEDRGKEFNYG